MKLKYSKKYLKALHDLFLSDPARGPLYNEIIATTEKQKAAAHQKLLKYGYINTANYGDGEQWKLYYNDVVIIEIVVCYWCM